MSEQTVSVKITAEDSTQPGVASATKGLKDLAAQADKTAGGTQSFTGAIKDAAGGSELANFSFTKMAAGMTAGLFTFEAVSRGIGAVVGFVSDSVTAYAEAEAAQTKMTAALRSSGAATPEVIGQYNDLATTFQQTTVYSDDLINEMEALLTQVGGVLPSQMKGALTAATDLASGLGIDLRTATLLVGKAFEGETGTLARYGIVIDETKLKTDSAGAVMDAIHEKFGGQAQSQINTYAGRVQQLGNDWNNTQEAIGGFVVQSPIVGAAMLILQEHIAKTNDGVSGQTKSWSEALRELSLFGKDAPNLLAHYVEKLEVAAQFVNDLATAQARLAAMPSPFAKMQGAGPVLPKLPSAAELDILQHQLALLNQEATNLDPTTKALIKSYAQLGLGTKEVADKLGLQEAVVKRVEDAQKAGAEAASKHAAELKKEADAAAEAAAKFDVLGSALRQSTDYAGNAFQGVTLFRGVLQDQTQDLESGNLNKLMMGAFGAFTPGGLVATAPGKIVTLDSSIGLLSRSFEQLANISGDSFGGIGQDIGQMISQMQVAIQTAETAKAGIKNWQAGNEAAGAAGLIAAGASSVAAVAQATSGGGGRASTAAKGALSGALQGAAWGSVVPGLGTAAGFVVGGIAGGIVGAFRGRGQGQKTNDARDSFITQNYGSDDIDVASDNLRRMAKEAGVADEEMKKLFSISKVDEFNKEAEKVSGQISEFYNDQTADAERLDDAIQKYGFSIEELGPKLQAQQLHEQAANLTEDWRVLVAAGVSVGEVNEHMGASMLDFLSKSQQTGTEVPEAMRPIIQSMIDQGLLLDANGQKIADIDQLGLTFAQTMTQGFDKIATKLDKLIKTLGGVDAVMDDATDSASAGLGHAADAADNLGIHLIASATAGSDALTTVGSAAADLRRQLETPIKMKLSVSSGDGDSASIDEDFVERHLNGVDVNGSSYDSDGTGYGDALAEFLNSNPGDEERAEKSVGTRAEWEAAHPEKKHSGGAIRRAHTGWFVDKLANDEVPIIAQTGEGVLSRRGMDALGGVGALNRLNAGQGGSDAAPINLTVALYVARDANGQLTLTDKNRSQVQDWLFGGRLQVPQRAVVKGPR